MLETIKPFNFILACDAYKTGHWEEIPVGIKKSYSVIVPRKASNYSNEIVAVGATLVAHVMSTIRITDAMIDEAEIEITEQGYNFNRKGWERIAHEYDGKLPLAVYGVEEGRVVSPQSPILGIINTDDYSAWLVSYVETWTHGVMWFMSTVASICRVTRMTIKEFMVLTGSDLSMLDYKCHNFGNRATTPESAIYAGIAHAVCFLGSDCTEANGYIKKLYNTTKAYTSSVEATEHATMCAHSDAANKDDSGAAAMVIKRLAAVVSRAVGGVGIPVMSNVIDTYDSRRYVRQFMGVDHHDAIVNSGGKLVMRPDSGDILVEPVTVAGDLKEFFGGAENSAGYYTLAPCVGILQGDGINVNTVRPVLQSFVDAKYSIDNLVLGMGHGTTHAAARDDFSFSMKAIAQFDGTKWSRMKKEPITDSGKNSLSGLVRCTEDDNGQLVVYDALTNGQEFSFLSEGPGWRLYSSFGYKNYRPKFDDVRRRANSNT